jgi:hypothetical protein
MQVGGPDFCTCEQCTIVCRGKFSGCEAVWARGPDARAKPYGDEPYVPTDELFPASHDPAVAGRDRGDLLGLSRLARDLEDLSRSMRHLDAAEKMILQTIGTLAQRVERLEGLARDGRIPVAPRHDEGNGSLGAMNARRGLSGLAHAVVEHISHGSDRSSAHPGGTR